ncbi:hypothetical protein QTO34_008643 [Cnephaeus nilssonii]|uniref:Fringe-like glycosyltransferase domain-containing protein n=1 Tax=Cnephaeus nilssonii TaxID=3371016 RepID=A0AA40LF96_CNENI|nr:hypothetical protein QTO34_008643 [Eptesicus nilssonii]
MGTTGTCSSRRAATWSTPTARPRHTRQALCCKMAVEYDQFIESGRKWFCHVDDDNYVNPKGLMQLLSTFSPSQDVYLGRPSLDHPIEATERVQGGGTGDLSGAGEPGGSVGGAGAATALFLVPGSSCCLDQALLRSGLWWHLGCQAKSQVKTRSDGQLPPPQVTTVKFWFATGGAGFCLSRGLALKMSPWASLGSFMSTAERVRLPDDCTVGYIVEGLLGARLRHSPLFHSHLEDLRRLPPHSVLQQVGRVPGASAGVGGPGRAVPAERGLGRDRGVARGVQVWWGTWFPVAALCKGRPLLSPVTGRGRGAAGSGLGVTGVPGQVPGTVSGLGLGHQLSPSRTAQPVTLQTCPRGPGTKPPPCPDPEGVTLSYGGPENPRNVVNVAGGFSLQQDPTRFKSVHCLLYPDTDWCPVTSPLSDP